VQFIGEPLFRFAGKDLKLGNIKEETSRKKSKKKKERLLEKFGDIAILPYVNGSSPNKSN
jgi:hypothetical protein